MDTIPLTANTTIMGKIMNNDYNQQFTDFLSDLEDKWMEKNIINSLILEANGVLNEVHLELAPIV